MATMNISMTSRRLLPRRRQRGGALFPARAARRCGGSFLLLFGIWLYELIDARRRVNGCLANFPAVPVPAVDDKVVGGASEDGGGGGVPKTIHFIHISSRILDEPSVPSESILANIDDWKTMHPDWTVRLWTNEEVRSEFKGMMPVVARIRRPCSWMSNLLRYAILCRYGGVYVDTGILPIRPLDGLLAAVGPSNKTFTVCEDPPLKFPASDADVRTSWVDCSLANNAVIGSEPGSPALCATLTVSVANTEKALCERHLRWGGGAEDYDLGISGPPLWTRVAREYGVDVLLSGTFFPCSWEDVFQCFKSNMVDRRGVFSIHAWTMTWKRQERERKNERWAKPKKVCGADPMDAREFRRDFNKLSPHPILTEKQGLWIMGTVRKSAPKPKLLVFGVGSDSWLWDAWNPCGRTVFVEDLKSWIDEVQGKDPFLLEKFQDKYPFLEIHHIAYQQREPKTTVGTADEFFTDPYVLQLPFAIDRDCFDTVLLDAPMGSKPEHPGRHEAAYWTMEMAKRCTKARQRPVYVYVHDCDRPLEKRIVEDMFIRNGGAVENGSMDSPEGLLRLVKFDSYR